MKRTILNNLYEWKMGGASKKPLILKGARQVGKTWALLEFGKEYYTEKGYNCHYIDFRKAKKLYSIFQETLDPIEIIKLLEFRLQINIDTQNDIVIFDEIQECPQAITSFKYFEQDLKELDIIGAGSHMGLLKNMESFPVGKVNFLYMFPLTFAEFVLEADSNAFDYLDSFNLELPFPSVVHERLLELFSIYSVIGGLPESVSAFLDKSSGSIRDGVIAARAVQEALLEGYRADFSKYSGIVNANHINCVFDSIPHQLSKTHDEEVGKFIFKDVIPNRKGFDIISGPLSWLQESRLCIKTAIAKKSGLPLAGYCDDNKFKVFLFDIGILNCMLNISCEIISNNELDSFKGYMLENFVAQELFAVTNNNLVSWQQGISELEFLITNGKNIIPLEVKSAKRNRRTKSLDSYIARYSPVKALKLTRQNFIKENARGITTIPVYCSYKVLHNTDTVRQQALRN